MKLKSGKLTFYCNGEWIGPKEMKEHTYYETLKAVNGIVETDHPISVQWLINRGYQIVEEKQETNREPIQEPVPGVQEERQEKVVDGITIDHVKRDWSHYKNPPGRPKKY